MHIKIKYYMRMNFIFDTKAPKKPTNVSINSELLIKARELKINLSATLENSLIEIVTTKQRELWKQQNREAICAYNQFVDENGEFSDGLRRF